MAENSSPERVLRVKNPNQTPPGGWCWKDVETGRIFSGDTFDGLEESVTGYLLSRSKDAGNVEAEIHQITAKTLWSKNRDLVEIETVEVKRTLRQYFSGASAIALGWWSESPIYGLIKGENDREGVFVTQEEADRRADVCCGVKGGEPCPENVRPNGKSWTQAWTDGEMIKSVDGKETRRHEDLFVCHACSCELRASVWWSPKIIKAAMRLAGYEGKLPKRCWRLNFDKE